MEVYNLIKENLEDLIVLFEENGYKIMTLNDSCPFKLQILDPSNTYKIKIWTCDNTIMLKYNIEYYDKCKDNSKIEDLVHNFLIDKSRNTDLEIKNIVYALSDVMQTCECAIDVVEKGE